MGEFFEWNCFESDELFLWLMKTTSPYARQRNLINFELIMTKSSKSLASLVLKIVLSSYLSVGFFSSYHTSSYYYFFLKGSSAASSSTLWCSRVNAEVFSGWSFKSFSITFWVSCSSKNLTSKLFFWIILKRGSNKDWREASLFLIKFFLAFWRLRV